ncbi:hypothetical protein VNO78_31119 [Psophocarpus tetragonolobus]|uniref:Uncharacterized protein n=1 Tax=Psophocarpus tetragonolobus TaxID=3891 RepID=A0AAN9RY89_PSOTE
MVMHALTCVQPPLFSVFTAVVFLPEHLNTKHSLKYYCLITAMEFVFVSPILHSTPESCGFNERHRSNPAQERVAMLVEGSWNAATDGESKSMKSVLTYALRVGAHRSSCRDTYIVGQWFHDT